MGLFVASNFDSFSFHIMQILAAYHAENIMLRLRQPLPANPSSKLINKTYLFLHRYPMQHLLPNCSCKLTFSKEVIVSSHIFPTHYTFSIVAKCQIFLIYLLTMSLLWIRIHQIKLCLGIEYLCQTALLPIHFFTHTHEALVSLDYVELLSSCWPLTLV